jgi:D-mannonate dehydratase
MKINIKTISIILLSVLACIALWFISKGSVETLFAALGVGGAAAAAKLLKNNGEKQKEEIDKKTDETQKVIDARPVENDIKTLTPETQSKIEEIKKEATNSIMDKIRKEAVKNE